MLPRKIALIKPRSAGGGGGSGGNIVTNGLILHYDIANLSCYPGSGFSLTDLSGNGNHGTLTATTSVVSQSLDFTGSSQITTSIQYTNPQSFSVNVWFKTSSTAGRKLIGFSYPQSGASSEYDRHFYVNTSGALIWGIWTGNPTVANCGNVADNQWRYASVSCATGVSTLFLNGQQVGTLAATPANYAGYWRIAGQTLQSWPGATDGNFVGQVGKIEIYNRNLSSNEIQQNFDATKSRFGL